MTNDPNLLFDFAAVTDIGCERTNNEDSYGYDSERNLYVVCDGMGGRAAGEVASSLAVRTLIEAFDAASHGSGAVEVATEDRLHAAMLEANRVVYQTAANDAMLQTMGTTLVCVCLEGNRAVVGNVGDSRAYLIRNGVCVQITMDHSLVQEAMRAGQMTAELAALPGVQSMITRAIGVTSSVELDLFAAQLVAGDSLLLSTDGLTRYVTADEIAATVSQDASLGDLCRALIETAKQRGGADNITCILLRAVKAPTASDGQGRREPAVSSDSMEAFTPMI